MKKGLLMFGAISMALGVCFGAMGAHALKGLLSADQLNSFNTAVRYQLFHSLSIIITSSIPILTFKQKNKISLLFTSGIVLFSGSIYLLSTQNLIGINIKWLGPITPIGGLLFISGWLSMAYCFFKSKEKQ